MGNELAKLYVTLAANVGDFTQGLASAAKDAASSLSPIEGAAAGAGAALDKVDQAGRHAADGLAPLAGEAKNLEQALEHAGQGAKDAEKASGDLAEGLKKAEGAASTATETFKGMLAAEVAVRALEAAWEFLTDAIGDAVHHLAEVDQLNAQTAAAIKSTGGAAGVSAQQIQDMANAIEKATGVEGEAVQRGANLLLTFTNIRDVAGKNNDIFTQSTKIMADMSVAMGQDMKSSALQLGKALNDPEKGMTALQRVGVAFTESQKETVKQLEATGHTLEAQKIILKELQTEFGGSAEAFGKTLPGAIEKSKAAWENLTDALLGPAMPAMKAGLTTLADAVNDVADAIQDKGLIGAIEDAFGPNARAIVIGLAAAFTVALWPAILEAGATFAAAAAAAAPLIATAAAVAFAARPIMEIWGTLPDVFSLIFKTIETTLQQWYQTVHDVASNVYTAFATVANNISSAFSQVFGGLGSFVSAAFNKLPDAVKGPLAGLGNAFSGFVSTAVSTVAQLPGMVGSHVAAVGKVIASPFIAGSQAIGKELSDAYQIGSTWLGNLQKYIGTFATESAGHFAKTVDAATGLGEGVKKGAKKAADEAAKQAKAIDDTFAKLESDLASIQIDLMLDPAMNGLKALEQQAGVLKGALKKLMAEGVNPADADFIKLKETLGDTNAAIDFLKSMDALDKKLATIEKTLSDFESEAQTAGLQAQALGSEYDDASKRASALEGVIKKLVSEGLDPQSETVKGLIERWGEAKQAMAADKEVKALTDVFDGLDKSLDGIEGQAAVLGGTFDGNAARAKAYKDAIQKLAAEGVDPTSDAIQELKRKLDEVASATDKLNDKVGPARAAIRDFHDGVKSAGEALGFSFEDPVSTAALRATDFSYAVAKVYDSLNDGIPAIVRFGKTLKDEVLPALVAYGSKVGAAVATETASMATSLSHAAAQAADFATAMAMPVVGALAAAGTAIASTAAGMVAFAASTAATVAGAVAAAIPAIGTALTSAFWAAAAAINAAILPVTEIAAAIAAAIIVGELIIENWEAISAVLTPIWDALYGVAVTVWGGISYAATAAANAVMSVAVPVWDAISAGLTATWQALAVVAGAVWNGITMVVGAAVGALAYLAIGAWEGVSAALQATWSALTYAGEAVWTGISGAVTAAMSAITGVLTTAWQGISAVLAPLWETLSAGAKAAAEAFVGAWSGVTGALGTIFDGVVGIFRGAFNLVLGIVNTLIRGLNRISFTVPDWVPGIGGNHWGINIAEIPMLAKGGVATDATMAMIGEAGPEAVLPLRPSVLSDIAAGIAQQMPVPAPAAAAAGGNVTIYLNYTGNGKWTMDDADQLGDLLVGRFRALGLRPS
jgi:phage-related protein